MLAPVPTTEAILGHDGRCGGHIARRMQLMLDASACWTDARDILVCDRARRYNNCLKLVQHLIGLPYGNVRLPTSLKMENSQPSNN
jgi:hypothetical protein